MLQLVQQGCLAVMSGEPIPLDMGAVSKHQQRLQRRTQERGGTQQHQPNAGDGRILGSPDSHEPSPEQLDSGEPLPFDTAAVAKHQQRLDERANKSGGTEKQQQPNAGDGRIFGSPDSNEPSPEQPDNGDPLPFDTAAVAKHQQRLDKQSNKSGGTEKQQQPNAGDGRVFGSPDSHEPSPEQLDSGEPLPFDTAAVAKHQQRLDQRTQQQQVSHGHDQHQPRTGDGRKMGSPDSQEPAPEHPLPLDKDAVDKHEQHFQEQFEEEQQRR